VILPGMAKNNVVYFFADSVQLFVDLTRVPLYIGVNMFGKKGTAIAVFACI
jgi:hypothetical protein